MVDLKGDDVLSIFKNISFDGAPEIISLGQQSFDNYFSFEEYLNCIDTFSHLLVDIVDPQILIRVMKGHNEIPFIEYCRKISTTQKSYHALEKTRLMQTIKSGATINLNMLERLSPKFRNFSAKLETILSCRLQSNLYYNEGNIAGFSPHYDTHDILALQIHGEKSWKISNKVVKNVSLSTPSKVANAPKDWDQDILLRKGDMIVLPRGSWHSVTGTGIPSLHITIGIRTPTFEDYLRWLGQHAGASEALRNLVSKVGTTEPTDSKQLLADGLDQLHNSGLTFQKFVDEFA